MTLEIIKGNTYPVKDELKALGARWDAEQKAWAVPSDRAEEARAIVAGAGPKTPAPAVSSEGWHIVPGNTYPVKDQLKSLGARWDSGRKAWIVPADKLAVATALAAPGQGGAPTKRCWECGCEFTYSDAKRRDGDWSDSYCGC